MTINQALTEIERLRKHNALLDLSLRGERERRKRIQSQVREPYLVYFINGLALGVVVGITTAACLLC